MRPQSRCRLLLFVLGCWVWTPGALAQAPQAPMVEAVAAVGMTVADMERSVAFYSTVLAFDKVADVEVVGSPYEQLQGVFGLRMRVVRMRLGDESVELTEFLAPRGRPISADSRSHDRWFRTSRSSSATWIGLTSGRVSTRSSMPPRGRNGCRT